MTERLLTVTDISAALGVCTKTARRLMREMGLVRVGDLVRVRESSFAEWLDDHEAKTRPQKRRAPRPQLPDRIPRR